MVARVGTLAVGTRFVTLATGREGRVRAYGDGETEVYFEGKPFPVWLHSGVRVRVVEATH